MVNSGLNKTIKILQLCVHEGIERKLFEWLGLVWFYGTSTIVGYSIPNTVYTYISNIYDL